MTGIRGRSKPERWIVVGSGASGLAAAFFLKQRGLDPVIVERDGSLGGRMGTVQLGNRQFDCGGKNIGRRYTLFRRFAASLGTHPLEYFGLNSSQVIDGHVKTLDAGARWRCLANVVRGLAVRDVVRFGQLLWSVRRDESAGYLGSPTARALGGRYDDLPASHYFSQEFCRRILRPMSVRMNGAEPYEVYMGNLTSNIRMLLDTYEQFTYGMAPLLGAFAAQYDVRLNTLAEGLLVKDGAVTGVQVRDANGYRSELNGAGVIIAAPAPVAATLTEPVLPALSRQLQSVAYYPVSLVIAEYDRPVFSSDVRAFIFDGDTPLSNAGAYGVNDLNVVRYTFSGKASRHLDLAAANPEALLASGEAALARHVPLPRNGRRFVARRFSPGLCAYGPHHGRFIDVVNNELRRISGLYLTGDYMQGASIEACFRAASACVQRLANHSVYVH